MNPAPSQLRRRHPGRALLLLAQPTILAVVIVMVCVQWRTPTLVQVDGIMTWNDALFDSAELQARLVSGNAFPAELREFVIQYSDYPDMMPQRAGLAGTLFLRPVDALVVEQFAPDLLQREIRISLRGLVAQVSLQQEGQTRDYRLTMFTRLKRSPFALGTGIAAWLGFTVLAWLTLYRQLKEESFPSPGQRKRT